MEKKEFKLSVVKELYNQAKGKKEVSKILKEEYGLNPREINSIFEMVKTKGWKPAKYANTITIIDEDEYPSSAPSNQ